jgi:hypothetical protein
MQYANEIFFVVSALILWGLVMISYSLTQSEFKDVNNTFWFWALVCTSLSYSIFAVASLTFIFLLTLANMFFVAGHLF